MQTDWDNFEKILKRRRSIRRFTQAPIAPEVMQRCFEAAVLAPNSSNTQTWDFHWAKSPEVKSQVVKACLSQSAARTAQELIIVTADPKLWRRSQAPLVQWVKDAKAPNEVLAYYEKLIPFVYRWGFLNIFAPIKWFGANLVGLFRPVPRGPYSRRDVTEIAIKSAALACENLVLAATAQGVASCMMEGFDERRLARILKLRRTTRIVMVIGLGYEGDRGTWGPSFRLPLSEVLHTR